MTDRIVTADREIAAPASTVFELIADPARQPEWDGNDNLSRAEAGQRVRAVGDVFTMENTGGNLRDNHVVAFEEGRLIAWRPSPQGGEQPGHQWAWEVEPIDDGRCRVTHIYDWTDLRDETRLERARRTDVAMLRASLDRLAALAEQG